MSGHSKWSTIKRQKGAQDAKRAVIFTKLSNAITLAVTQGGGIADPDLNYRLRLAIDDAKASNMPKDNIKRAIDRVVNAKGEGMQEVSYEGFGPNGIAVIAEGITDNKLRTNSEIKNIFDKRGGSFATPGSVSYQFEKLGLIEVDKNGISYDDLFMLAAESGAEDTQEVDEVIEVYTKPNDLMNVKDKLSDNSSVVIKSASLIRKASNTVKADNEEKLEGSLDFLSQLEEHPDITQVFSNLEV